MICKLEPQDIHERLSLMPHAPRHLYAKAQDKDVISNLMQRPRIAIVGTRMVSTYGRAITHKLSGELAARGIVIVSGLALGTDGIAHRAALEANGLTMAVLPGPVEHIYPRSHQSLADQIVDSGGALFSEYSMDSPTYKGNFVARNRIVTGIADALLITEAAEKSGTMHTSAFAMEQGITVFAVPGSVFSQTSEETNNLIKTGAIPVTRVEDILYALDLHAGIATDHKVRRSKADNPSQQILIDLIEKGVMDGSELLARSNLSVEDFNHHMTMLEITTRIRAHGANQWGLA